MDGTARRLGSRLPLAHEGIVRRFRSLIRGLGVSDTLPMVRRLERRSTDGGTSGGTRFRNVQKRFYYQLDNRTIRLLPLPFPRVPRAGLSVMPQSARVVKLPDYPPQGEVVANDLSREIGTLCRTTWSEADHIGGNR